jgi:hypothetical protein
VASSGGGGRRPCRRVRYWEQARRERGGASQRKKEGGQGRDKVQSLQNISSVARHKQEVALATSRSRARSCSVVSTKKTTDTLQIPPGFGEFLQGTLKQHYFADFVIQTSSKSCENF